MVRDVIRDDAASRRARSPVLYEKGMIPIYNTILFMSSGFFTGLEGGVRFTDSRFNAGGPLPTDMSSGPQGANGVADGIYNGTDQLLEGISPYAMPKQGSLNANKGPQTARRVAAGIPRVELPEPEPDSDSTFSLCHAVDNGDVAFIVTPTTAQKYAWLSPKPYAMQSQKHLNSLVNVNVFLNIVQVNYVLAGIFNRILYRVEFGRPFDMSSSSWDLLINSFGVYAREFSNNIVETCRSYYVKEKRSSAEDAAEPSSSDDEGSAPDPPWKALFLLQTKILLQHILQFHIRPFGICAGSEKQGGQHEARDKPVQAAASYFTTLTVDGQNRDLVNIWRNGEIEGGDQLILHLAPVARSSKVLYTLNHFNNGTVSKYVSFRPLMKQCTLQLVPTFYKAGELPEDYRSDLKHVFLRFAKDYNEEQNDVVRGLLTDAMDYRVAGYWHCGQTYTKSARYGQVLAPFSDHEYMTGAAASKLGARVEVRERTRVADGRPERAVARRRRRRQTETRPGHIRRAGVWRRRTLAGVSSGPRRCNKL